MLQSLSYLFIVIVHVSAQGLHSSPEDLARADPVTITLPGETHTAHKVATISEPRTVYIPTGSKSTTSPLPTTLYKTRSVTELSTVTESTCPHCHTIVTCDDDPSSKATTAISTNTVTVESKTTDFISSTLLKTESKTTSLYVSTTISEPYPTTDYLTRTLLRWSTSTELKPTTIIELSTSPTTKSRFIESFVTIPTTVTKPTTEYMTISTTVPTTQMTTHSTTVVSTSAVTVATTESVTLSITVPETLRSTLTSTVHDVHSTTDTVTALKSIFDTTTAYSTVTDVLNRTNSVTQSQTTTVMNHDVTTLTESIFHDVDTTKTISKTQTIFITPTFESTTGVDELSDGQVQHRTKPPSYSSSASPEGSGGISQSGRVLPSTWTTLTPQARPPPDATKAFNGTFGIGVKTLDANSKASQASALPVQAISNSGEIEGGERGLQVKQDEISSVRSFNIAHESAFLSSTLERANRGTGTSTLDTPWHACKGGDVLKLHLDDSVIYDVQGRVGSIVSNRQFQFDGPPPQSGTIYAAGWSIYDGMLNLGNQNTFYQCRSGDFFNIYDESIASYCEPIQLIVLSLVDCN